MGNSELVQTQHIGSLPQNLLGVTRETGSGDAHMHIIALANQKGGVGKTTTAVNLAGELARRNHRVLLIDCDPQGNATTSLGIAKRDLGATMYEVLMGLARAEEVLRATGRPGYDIIPASEHLAGAMVELTSVEEREWQLTQAIQSLEGKYDRILLDCP